MAAHEESLRRLALHDEQCVQCLLGIRLSGGKTAGLDPKTHALVRLAALIALGASCIRATDQEGSGTTASRPGYLVSRPISCTRWTA